MAQPFGVVDNKNASAPFVGSKLSLLSHVPDLVNLYELTFGLLFERRILALAQNRSNISVFVANDLSAGYAVSAGLSHPRLVTIQRLRQTYRKLILADASRAGQQQRLADAVFCHRSGEQCSYAVVTDES